MIRSTFCKWGLAFTLSLSCLQSTYGEGFEGQYREYGDHPLDLVARFLPEDPVIFEAGGHYGTDTAKFSLKWPLGEIITFEPNPHAFEILQEATTGLDNVHIHNLAVSDESGFATLYVCHGTNGENPIFEGASSLLESSEEMKVNYMGPEVQVPCVVLDEWCREQQVDHIDFMWLDLEGLELQVLKSSPQILSTVKVIYTETNFRFFRKEMTQYKNLRKFLEKQGFKMLSHWYTLGIQGNAIFVRNELLDQAL